MSNASREFTDRRGRRYRITQTATGRSAQLIPAHVATHEAPQAQEAGTTMPTFTPTAPDIAYSRELDERARRLQLADPGLSYNVAVTRAAEQLRRGERVADPDRTILHSMAQRYAVDHKVGYREALVAVGAEYDRIVGGPVEKPAHIIAGEELDRATQRRMAEDPKLSYRDALLLESAKTPSKRPSDKIVTPKAEPEAAADPDVWAYAEAKGITYAAALLELAKAGLAAATDEDAPAAAAVTGVTTAAIPSPAQIQARAKSRGIKNSAALVELMAEGR